MGVFPPSQYFLFTKITITTKILCHKALMFRFSELIGNTRNVFTDFHIISNYFTTTVRYLCVSRTCRFSPSWHIVHIPADDGPDPANLSLSERIKLFNIKMSEQQKLMMMQKREREAPRRRLSRFQTQPITPDEVESAKCITPPHVALLGVFFVVFFWSL